MIERRVAPSGRRAWIAVGALAVLLTLGLWLAATVEKSPLTRSFGGKKVPKVLAGRDERPEEERRVVHEEADAATVRCEYEGEGSPGNLVAMQAGEVLTSGSDLSLRLPAGSWTMYWQSGTEGSLALGTVEAEPGEVETCRLTAEGWALSGTVRNLEGQPVAGTFVYTCAGRVKTNEGGAFTGVGTSRACQVRAVYQDGVLQRRSEVATVTAFDGRSLELVVDDAPIAGMGLAFRMVEGGARIRFVHPGTPAEEAGLEEGDIITSVDGEPTAGLSDDAFIALGTGREGSRIDVQVERNGEKRSFSFHRERIESVDTG